MVACIDFPEMSVFSCSAPVISSNLSLRKEAMQGCWCLLLAILHVTVGQTLQQVHCMPMHPGA